MIERYKSGDVPPGDFKFEDMNDPAAMLAQDALEKPTNLNLYQRKREIEADIKARSFRTSLNVVTIDGFVFA